MHQNYKGVINISARVGTVTINPAMDRILTIKNFATKKHNRASDLRIDIGGKGTHVAVAAKLLGVEAVATGVLAGPTGRTIAEMMARLGVTLDFVWVDGCDTRHVYILIEPKDLGNQTILSEPGFLLAPQVLAELEIKVREMAMHCQVVSFAGNLPPGLDMDYFVHLLHIAKQAGTFVIVDVDGALQAKIKAKPDLVKPTFMALENAFNIKIKDEQDLLGACRQLIANGVGAVFVSQGGEHAMLVTDDRSWRLAPPAVPVQNTAGCGDATIGGIAAGICKSLPLLQAVRLGMAMGTHKATLMNTTASARMSEIDAIFERITVRDLNPS